MGLYQYYSRRLIILLPSNGFLHSSPEAPRTIQERETSVSEGRNYYQGIQLANPEFTKVLGSFTCRKAGTWDRFFHFPSEGRNAEDYSDTQKIQQASAGFEPANSGTRGQHANHQTIEAAASMFCKEQLIAPLTLSQTQIRPDYALKLVTAASLGLSIHKGY